MQKFKKYLPFLILLNPLIYSSLFYESFLSPKYLFFILLLPFTIISIKFKEKLSIFTLIFFLLLSYFIFLDIKHIDSYYFLFLGLILYYISLLNIFSENPNYKIIKKFIIFNSILISIEGLVAYLSGFNSVGFVGSHKFSAMICLIALNEILYLDFKKWYSWILLIFISAYLITDSSLAIRLGIAIIFILRFYSLFKDNKYLRFSIIIFFLLISIFLLNNRYNSNRNSYDFRKEVWMSSLRMFLDNPFGIGMNNFQDVYNLYRSKREFLYRGENTVVENAHNDLITTIVEGGIPVLIILLVFFIFLFRIALKMIRNNDFKSISGLCIVILLSLVSYPFRILPTAMFMLIPIAYIEQNYGENISFKFPKYKLVLFLFSLIALYGSIGFIVGDYYTQQGLEKKDESLLLKSANMRKDYIGWWKLGILYREEKKYKKSMSAFIKSLEFAPFNPYTYSQIGYIYIKLKKYDKAILFYKKALDILPWSKTFQKNIYWLKRIKRDKG